MLHLLSSEQGSRPGGLRLASTSWRGNPRRARPRAVKFKTVRRSPRLNKIESLVSQLYSARLGPRELLELPQPRHRTLAARERADRRGEKHERERARLRGSRG